MISFNGTILSLHVRPPCFIFLIYKIEAFIQGSSFYLVFFFLGIDLPDKGVITSRKGGKGTQRGRRRRGGVGVEG